MSQLREFCLITVFTYHTFFPNELEYFKSAFVRSALKKLKNNYYEVTFWYLEC